MNKITEVPKTLDECVIPDKTSENLHLWAQRLEKWGLILFWIILAGGIIPAFSIITKGEDFYLFITEVLDTIVYAFIEYCIYHALSLLISSLASIVKHTKITAKTALYMASKNADPCVENTNDQEAQKDNDDIINKQIPKTQSAPQHKWRCSACGNMISENPCKYCNK